MSTYKLSDSEKTSNNYQVGDVIYIDGKCRTITCLCPKDESEVASLPSFTPTDTFSSCEECCSSPSSPSSSSASSSPISSSSASSSASSPSSASSASSPSSASSASHSCAQVLDCVEHNIYGSAQIFTVLSPDPVTGECMYHILLTDNTFVADVAESDLTFVSCPSSSGPPSFPSSFSVPSSPSTTSSGSSSASTSGSGPGGYEYSLQDCDNASNTTCYKSPDDLGVAGASGTVGTIFYEHATQTCWHITFKTQLDANGYTNSSCAAIVAAGVTVYGTGSGECDDCYYAQNCTECDLCEQFYDAQCNITGTSHNTNSYWWSSADTYTPGTKVVHWTPGSSTSISVYECAQTNFNIPPNQNSGANQPWTKLCTCSCTSATNGDRIYPCT